MNEARRIADSYRAVTIKGAWYGLSFAVLLTEISPELATTRPASEVHFFQ
jgi:hypothetical protein